MRTFTKLAIAGTMALLGSSAQALPSFAQGSNDIFFNSLENQYRTVAACAVVDNCLPASPGNDPAGWLRVDPTTAGDIQVGDVFVGIMRVQNIDPLWDSAVGNRFNGYLAQEVDSIDISGFPTAVINWKNPTVDPFGVLGAGEMFRLYTGVYNFTGSTAGTAGGMVSALTAEMFWGSLGLDGTKNTYAYSTDNFSVPGTSTKTEFFAGLDLVLKGPSYNVPGVLKLVNDLNEGDHGVINPSFLCSAADLADPAISCSQVVGTAEIEFNKNSMVAGIGDSPWIYAGNDPLSIFVPEPDSIALLGLGLIGIALRRRRAA